jgi:hypothetical protein
LLWESYRFRLARLGKLRRNRLLSPLYRHGRLMAFCDLQALLVEHLVPLRKRSSSPRRRAEIPRSCAKVGALPTICGAARGYFSPQFRRWSALH